MHGQKVPVAASRHALRAAASSGKHAAGLRCMSSAAGGDKKLNKWSSTVTEPKSQGASQAMLYATGLDEKTIRKPQVGIASMWWTGNPCNMHLLDLSHHVKD